MSKDVAIKITDREGTTHKVQAPTDMNMNIMEVIRMYELAPEGTIGICGGMAIVFIAEISVYEKDHNSFLRPVPGDRNDACTVTKTTV